MKDYGSQLQECSRENLNLLLYGCNVAAGDAGEEFLNKLHSLTGANIAASATKTGKDTLYGNIGNDSLSGGDGNDYLNGYKDNDTLDGNNGDDLVFGQQGNDILYGADGNDSLYGEDDGTQNQTYDGSQDNDTLYGGNGNDVLVGGLGNDVLVGELGADKFIFNRANEGTDRIKDFNRLERDKILITALNFGTGVTLQQFNFNYSTNTLFFNNQQIAILDNVTNSNFSVSQDVTLI
ncbi:hypothetical protein A6S26_06460 [Nostoc sp. ATCC 43529]|nr:hypothetical protein A6S26_06460 [Nostoc sp. ATCC 43529]